MNEHRRSTVPPPAANEVLARPRGDVHNDDATNDLLVALESAIDRDAVPTGAIADLGARLVAAADDIEQFQTLVTFSLAAGLSAARMGTVVDVLRSSGTITRGAASRWREKGEQIVAELLAGRAPQSSPAVVDEAPAELEPPDHALARWTDDGGPGSA